MEKKLVAAILAATLLTFCGCATINVNNESAAGDEIAQEIIESTSEDASQGQGEQITESLEQITAPEKSSQYLNVEFDYFTDSCYEETSLMYGHYNTIKLNSTEYPALTEAVDAYNEVHASEAQSYLDEMEEWAKELYKEYGADMFIGPYVAEYDMYLRRADAQVLSVAEACYSYEGGAHGNSYYNTVNFDVQTGEEIALESVITDMNSLPGILATEIQEKYTDLTFWSEDLASLLQDYVTPSSTEYVPTFTWTIDYQGVTFYFSDYELGSYANGRQEVMISYSEYPEILDSKYFENVENNYVVALLNNWTGTDLDLNNDGVTDYVSVRKNYSVDTDFCESYDVTVNDNTFTHDVYFYDLWTYYVKSGDDSYLYVQRRAESDFETVSVFRLTENSVEYVDDFSNGLGCFTNSLDFEVSKRMDLLSTYFAMADCSIGADGLPIETNGIYTVTGEVIITSTVPITADLVDAEGNLLGSSYEFPAGTDFRFISTDGATYVNMQASDGKSCRFYTSPEWPPTVNEMNAESCFEMLWYAG